MSHEVDKKFDRKTMKKYDKMRDKVMRWHIEQGTTPFNWCKEDECVTETDMYIKSQIKNSLF